MTVDQTIPVVDLTDFGSDDQAARDAFIEELGDALEDVGFVAVEGHSVSSELIEANYEAFTEFFALPEETKKKYEDPSTGRQRGYTSFGVEHAKDSDTPDLKEFWHVGRELPEDHELYERMPTNVWPEEIPELRKTALALYEAMDHCAMNLLRAFSIYLEQDADFLSNLARDGNSVIRTVHYPVCDGFDEPGVMRAAAHEDINLLTLLPEATESGLEILTRDGDWMAVPSVPGQMIVDTGDMMSWLTNDVIPATTHRVVNPEGEPTDRYSMPFFVHPHPDAMLEVIDSCLDEGESPKYPPITADHFLKQRLEEIGVA